MFRDILVPLDGSHLAEEALPAAAYFARKFGGRLILVHLLEAGAPKQIHGEPHLTAAAEAGNYLDLVSRKSLLEGIEVLCHVHSDQVGDVARSIVDHIGEMRPDLIVMCTHGEHHTRNLLFGSLAQKVVSLGTVPVLLIHPHGEGETPAFSCRNLLVPLDGKREHEAGLQFAARLAEPCAAVVLLVMVVPTLGTLSGEDTAKRRLAPGAVSELLDQEEQVAASYLLEQESRLRVSGLEVRSEVLRGDPVDAVADRAISAGIDIQVLGTHGKAGVSAFWSGSFAARLATRSTVPMLLIPL